MHVSDRRLSDSANRARDWQRRIEERLYRLENGGAIAGNIGLDSKFTIGTVQVEVVDLGGGSVNLVFTNLVTGSKNTISLP